jgi:transcriptional regulator GlxA family with amidase domain
MLRICFHQLLLLLIRQSERKYRRHPEWTANYIQEYIRKNFSSDISLRELAVELHLSRERLCRLYKTHFGHTIGTEIKSLRVKKACGLLKAGSMNTAEICKQSGFRDASNFYRHFRAFIKKTPQQFRQTNQKACK